MSEKKEKKSKKVEEEEVQEEPEVEVEKKKKKKSKDKDRERERESEEPPKAEEEEEQELTKEERKAKRKLEKQKEKEKEEQEETIRKKEKAEIEVHTANNWEEADLGNDERKLKFLKLMGATKHHDDHEVAHKHARGATETKKINEELEKQFNDGLNSKFNRAHHLGLGFDSQSESKAYTKANNSRIKFNDDDEAEVVSEKKAEESKPASAPVEAPKKPADDKLKFKKMVFVKSSS